MVQRHLPRQVRVHRRLRIDAPGFSDGSRAVLSRRRVAAVQVWREGADGTGVLQRAIGSDLPSDPFLQSPLRANGASAPAAQPMGPEESWAALYDSGIHLLRQKRPPDCEGD